MPRIAGVDVPPERPLHIGLTYIHGVGRTTARKILDAAGLESGMRVKNLTEDQVSLLNSLIDRDYMVEGSLRRQVSQNVARLRDIACYRGLRHRRGLPVRGQRTRSNARTRKGPRKTVAGKKSVKATKS